MPPAAFARNHRPWSKTPIFVVPVPSQSQTTGIAVGDPKPITLQIPPAAFARNHNPLSKTPTLDVGWAVVTAEITVTKALPGPLLPPPKIGCTAFKMGKLVEVVCPVTYALPKPAAMPRP